MFTQRRHCENAKMVKWIYIVQEFAKIDQDIRNNENISILKNYDFCFKTKKKVSGHYKGTSLEILNMNSYVSLKTFATLWTLVYLLLS